MSRSSVLLPPNSGFRRHRDPRKAEAQLARLACEHRPDELAKLADKLTDCLNPDGDFTDVDRARRRGITIGRQDIDGMSPISGYLTPEARATFDAVFAKLAAPGMCNSADDPCLSGTPPSRHRRRHPQHGQRNHDALLAPARALLASGELGQHNGLPATIIVTTTLQELEAGAGSAHRRRHAAADVRCGPARLATPTTTWPSSTKAKRWRSITPNAWPHPPNELCCTPRIVAAPPPAAPYPGYLCEVHHCNP